ncbi:hypothetical protein PO124_19605 [Bacillus licheniformis]|nr:hypothetical protein [Bacillus licheniformis]
MKAYHSNLPDLKSLHTNLRIPAMKGCQAEGIGQAFKDMVDDIQSAKTKAKSKWEYYKAKLKLKRKGVEEEQPSHGRIWILQLSSGESESKRRDCEISHNGTIKRIPMRKRSKTCRRFAQKAKELKAYVESGKWSGKPATHFKLP